MEFMVNHMLLLRRRCAGSDVKNMTIFCVHGGCYPDVLSKDKFTSAGSIPPQFLSHSNISYFLYLPIIKGNIT
jgi:hypothetical protein